MVSIFPNRGESKRKIDKNGENYDGVRGRRERGVYASRERDREGEGSKVVGGVIKNNWFSHKQKTRNGPR